MNAVEIKDLSWRYERAESFALESLNLIIEENKFIGIVGPNESGKTTLVSAIKGIIPSEFNGIYKGSVEIFGKKVTDCSSRDLAKMVGMVFADPDSQFTSMSVEEEISFGLENIGCTVEEIDERIKWVSELTNISELLEKPPYDLSGGQKQRVAIASIIAMKPRIIILDEPTSMLDPVSKDMVFNLLETMKKNLNLTIIVVEHNIEKLVELSDMMILINDGKIEQYKKTEDFFDDLDFLDSRSIRVPGAIRFVKMVNDEENLKTPVHLNKIAEKLKQEIRGEK